jgi:TonB family protein
MKIRWRSFLVLCGALFAAGAAAQPARSPGGRDDVYIPAEPVNRVPPNYPQNAMNLRREGWVLVSFIISEEGDVIEPMIEESSSKDFDSATLRAIRSWHFKPATLGGKPVEQSMVQTIIRYQLQDSKGANAPFVKKYRAVYPLIAAKNFSEAGPLLEALEKGELNFYEQAWLSWLKYVYLDAMGTAEPDALLDSLRKALGSSGNANDDYLEPDVFVSASQRLYVLEVRRGDFSEAVADFKRLEASKTAQRSKLYKDAVASLEPSYREVMNLVAGTKILGQTARVDEHNYWVHRMLRRSFAFGDVQGGKLEVVDVRCTRANRRFVSMPENAVLKIPDTWGDCSVYIKGDEGTTFAFEEYPADYASAVDPTQVAPTKE